MKYNILKTLFFFGVYLSSVALYGSSENLNGGGSDVHAVTVVEVPVGNLNTYSQIGVTWDDVNRAIDNGEFQLSEDISEEEEENSAPDSDQEADNRERQYEANCAIGLTGAVNGNETNMDPLSLVDAIDSVCNWIIAGHSVDTFNENIQLQAYDTSDIDWPVYLSGKKELNKIMHLRQSIILNGCNSSDLKELLNRLTALNEAVFLRDTFLEYCLLRKESFREGEGSVEKFFLELILDDWRNASTQDEKLVALLYFFGARLICMPSIRKDDLISKILETEINGEPVWFFFAARAKGIFIEILRTADKLPFEVKLSGGESMRFDDNDNE